jgi:hypothetical protein
MADAILKTCELELSSLEKSEVSTNYGKNHFYVSINKCCKMLGDISKAEKMYIEIGHTDMRKSVNGLAAIVQKKCICNFT